MNKRYYDNSACNGKDHEVGARASLEMDRVTVENVKCCGGGRAGDKRPRAAASSNAPPLPNVCAPQCPAVETSPWDPVKTWVAIFLSVAMIVWAALGFYYIKFRKN